MRISRKTHLRRLRYLLGRSPVVAILGQRQVGKTTLARDFAASRSGPTRFYDLEDPASLARLQDPMLELGPRRGLVVLDEIHRVPGLFACLRVLADRPRTPARFLVLGSASEELLRQSSESLAGRIAFHELRGFSVDEAGIASLERLWIRGGLPASFLARSEKDSIRWRQDFVRTFLERDLPQLGISIASTTLERFWAMLAHYHGQIWNASEFARSFGVSNMTVGRYLDILSRTFVVRTLRPWFENLAKRQVKAPKVYLTDTGILHSLLAIGSKSDLERHPKLGASWESFGLQAVIDRLGVRGEECYYWATHAGAELDLLVVRGRTRLGFEFKRTSAPQLTPSMRTALEDLHLQRLDVVHGGDDTFPMAPRIRAVALSRILDDLKPLAP